MKKLQLDLLAILFMFFCTSLLPNGLSQDQPRLEVIDSAICTNVENHDCLDPKEEFSATVDRLYCFTRITGGQGDTDVVHVWYYGDIERARVTLAVRSSSYRTYSSKRIQAHEIGQWRVEVLDSKGTLLKKIPFSIVQ